MENLIDKIRANGRISHSDALQLKGASLFDFAELAQARMSAMGYGERVSYIVNRMINYSNICLARCKFCAYHARAGVVSPYRMSDAQILEIVGESVKMGAVQIMFQGGISPEFTLDWACEILSKIRQNYPNLFLHVFSPSEVVAFAKNAGVSIFEAVFRLKNAGANSIPGAADMLVERIRQELSPLKASVAEWEEVMRALAKNKMFSSATMTFGLGETFEDRLEHLFRIRTLQDELGVFKAFIAWPLAPENTRLEGLVERASSIEFLKTIALSRIVLDNIKVIQSGWLTEGMGIAELAILFGANDMGGVLMDELVVKSAGISNSTTALGMERAIKNAGKIPFRRNGLYEAL